MQPIRFFKPGDAPDWIDNWPNMDNIYPRREWIPGLSPTEYFSDWVINNQISIQLSILNTGNEDLFLYKYNQTSGIYELYATVSPVDITPTNWVSEQRNRYNYTPSEAGVYYFDSPTAGYRSDKFVVHNTEKFKRRLVKIEYYNSENDYGIVFFNGSEQIYEPIAFFTGGLFPEIPGNKISAFDSDRGNLIKLRSTPKKTALLRLSDIHYSQKSRINNILSCDNLTVNGITYQNMDIPEMELIDNSDLVNFTVKVIQTNYEYFIS